MAEKPAQYCRRKTGLAPTDFNTNYKVIVIKTGGVLAKRTDIWMSGIGYKAQKQTCTSTIN